MKRILSLLLLFVLLVSVTPAAFAAERGETVTISFSTSGNPGCNSFQGDIVYDSSALELVSVEKGSWGSLFGLYTEYNGSVVFSSFTGDISGDGVAFVATFKVKDDAAKGTYSVSFAPSDYAYNSNGDEFNLSISGGSVTVTIPPCAVHTYGALTGTEPSCDTAGVKTQTCSVCGDVNTVTTPAIGHTAGDWNVTKEATCTATGTKEQKCTVCQTILKTETIAVLPHTPGEGQIKTPATCEKPGVFVGKCAVCQQDLDETEIPALGHQWNEGAVTKAPTCEVAGVKTYTCGRDASHTKEEAIAPIGHDWDEGRVTTEPACETEGVKTFTCKNDSAHTKTEAIKANGHTADENSVRVEPTCETDGSITGKCAVCKKELEKEVIPALGHDWVEQTDKAVAPTCDENGKKFFVCANDAEHTKEEIVPALGHNPGAWTEDNGVTATGTCQACGVKIEHTHDYRHETSKVNGKQKVECACGAYILKDLPANSADLDDVPKTGDITSKVAAFVFCTMAAVMAAAFVFKRKAV